MRVAEAALARQDCVVHRCLCKKYISAQFVVLQLFVFYMSELFAVFASCY